MQGASSSELLKQHYWDRSRRFVFPAALFVFSVVVVQADAPWKLLVSFICIRAVNEFIFTNIEKSTTYKPVFIVWLPLNTMLGTSTAVYCGGPSSPGWLFTLIAITTYTTVFKQVSPEWMHRKVPTGEQLFNLNWYALAICFIFTLQSSAFTLLLFGNWQTTSTCFVTCVFISVFVNACEGLIYDLQHMAEVVVQNRELEKSKQNAELESQQKTVFIAKVSHELRTPLHAIICSCDLLADTVLTEEQRGFTKIISKSSQLLLELINNILDLSKYEAGKIVLESRNFSLQECLETVVNTMATKSNEKNKSNVADRK